MLSWAFEGRRKFQNASTLFSRISDSLGMCFHAGSGKLRLVSFITDDYPNSWQDEMEVEDDAWYHVTALLPEVMVWV